MEIQLYYITNYGSEWLERNFTVTRDNYKSIIDNYVSENQSIAERLEYKWRCDGEDVSLNLIVDSNSLSFEDCSLMNDILDYVDSKI